MELRFKVVPSNKVKRNFILGIILILFISLSFFGLTRDVYKNQQSYKESLIRFHVLANGDSPADQELKLQVRDRIIEEMNPKFQQSKSLAETREIIKSNLQRIEQVAQEELRKHNSDYVVAATLGEQVFPTKSYGSITLPAGDYEALKIVIGKGEGSNWWCVLFPPLCFIDMKNGLTDEKTKNELMNVLTEEEFQMISTASSEEKIPIKLKFKTVEILEQAKASFEKIVGVK